MAVLATPLRRLWRGARLVSLADAGWGLIEDGALLCDGGQIAWVGRADDAPAADEVIELGGALVTPGLIDAHTHLVYAGSRAHEFEQRLHGASYAEIAAAGGGIRSTVAATRAASEAQLLSLAQARADTLAQEGVTTVEVKSGYGLSFDSEARLLRVARSLKGLDVRTTCLAAHALAPEFPEREAYVDAVCAWLPDWHAAGLVDAVDAFCEGIAFSPAQVRRVFEVARRLGLPVKLHAEQLSDQGGAALAAEFAALSADHLEWLSADGVSAMAAAGTVAMLLPGAYYFLRETRQPPVAALRAAGVPIALATDHNPGSSPTLSPLLMMNMACVMWGLTPEEAWRGFTVNAARALGLSDRGRLAPGLQADFCVWDAQHPRELVAAFGQHRLRRRVWRGQ